MGLKVTPYTDDQSEQWDALVAASTSGTILHTRRYLGYHGDRFKDGSLLFWDGGRLEGVLPAALDPGDPGTVISHPGITFGGVLHSGGLRGTEMLTAMRDALNHYAGEGRSRFLYKAVPRIYHKAPSEDDLYALFRVGARCYRRDLSTAMDLNHRLEMSSRRKRALQKARKLGVVVSQDICDVSSLWEVLKANLLQKHGVRPVHSVEEICQLRELFPENIYFLTAHIAGRLVAGVVLFVNQTVIHAQYIASNDEGREAHALDLVFDRAIGFTEESGRRFFSFGSSCEDNGMTLNEGLYRFKAEFGGAGIVHEFYEIQLGSYPKRSEAFV